MGVFPFVSMIIIIQLEIGAVLWESSLEIIKYPFGYFTTVSLQSGIIKL